MRITFISTVVGSSVIEAARDIGNNRISLNIIYPHEITEERTDESTLKSCLDDSDVVILDIRGGGRAEELVYKHLKDKDKTVITLLGSDRLFSLARLGAFSMDRFPKRNEVSDNMRSPIAVWERIKKVQKIVEIAGRFLPFKILKDARNYVMLLKYWGFSCKENYKNMFLLLGTYFGIEAKEIKPPKEFPEYGIYHPDYGIFKDIESYMNANPEIASLIKENVNNEESLSPKKPIIGVLFTGGSHFEQNYQLIKDLVIEFDEFHVIPVYTNGIYNLKAIEEFFFFQNKPYVDFVLRLLWFRLNGGPFGGDPQMTINMLKNLNVPVFTPVMMYLREVKEWERSEYGLSLIETIADVVWPEMDGGIEPIPIAGLKDFEIDGYRYKEMLPIKDRANRIKNRILKWHKLKIASNNQKRIAIIVYDYPPGEANVGRAAYLDTFKSVERILEILDNEGFVVNSYEGNLQELFEKYHIVNSGKWLDAEEIIDRCFSLSRDECLLILNQIPSDSVEDMNNIWGEPIGKIMTHEDKILIPGIQLGNIFIGIQPSRPPLDKEDVKNVAHDKTKPPHHQYVAFYRWIEEVWKADAIIHVGTHGLAEFMKGKEIGMSEKCFPDILIGNLPNIYIYHVLNTSEATIAKRRLYGMMISYNSPPYTAADLYEDYLLLEDYIHEYNDAQKSDPVRANMIRDNIFKKAKDLHIESEDIDSIHESLYRLKRSIIPKGLHLLGEKYSNEDMIDFMAAFARFDRGDIKSLNRIISRLIGYDYDSLMKDRSKNIQILSNIDDEAKRLIAEFINKGKFLLNEKRFEGVRDDLLKTLENAFECAKRFIDNSQELGSLIRALRAEFIEPSTGGDVIRTPESLPTGRNIFQFDPTKVPTDTANQRGAEIAENTLRHYQEMENKYPESVGIVLWGFETTQTHGETIGQILSYFGVRVVRRYGSWHPELEVIPLSELNRPRIDCLINICGFFREMFPNLVLLIDRAVNMVANLNEPEELNFIKKHSRANYEALKDSQDNQMPPEYLQKIANGRIFGPPPSEYGTRMLPLIEDSVWQTEEELAEIHIQSMNYLHAENLHAQKMDNIYRQNIKRIDIVSQVRSSHDYEVVDLDHYFEFFGGLSRSVEMEKGSKPEMLISDTTEEIVRTEFIGKTIEHGSRARFLNPKWIEEMLKHDFHGAQQIAQRFENLLGLSATTGAVDNWLWEKAAERYIFDKEIRERLLKNNKWATMEIIERLFEANKRGYWDVKEDKILELQRIFLEVEGWIEEKAENLKNFTKKGVS